MIPALIYFLLKKYRIKHPEKAQKLMTLVKNGSRVVILLIIFLAATQFSIAQERKLEYAIKRKGSEVGSLFFTQAFSGNKLVLKMESEVRTRMIFLFTAKAKEESIYENGIMTWSSIYRKMNGNEKANKKTRLAGTNYIVTEDDDTEALNNYPIRYNMLSLYTNEPVNISKVYSDNFQRFLDIQTIAPHHYKIKFPDGTYNEYIFSNGVCVQIKIHHSLYSASIELKS
ncbi:MAG TPA: DUF6134 family protein [Chitinophagaceae bacterium]